MPLRVPHEFHFRVVRAFEQYNPIGKAQRNVAHHYDLKDELYDLFLDPDRQYSCAYFAEPGMTLEEAQLAKKRHIAAKLLLHPGQRVLDIGSGWGGLGLHLAETDGIDVTGVTLSTEQLALANERAVAAGARPMAAPLTKPWGQTVAYVRCPDGTLVELCTAMG